MANDKIRPFEIAIPQSQLDDLKTRLGNARFPESSPADGWQQGIPLDYVQDLTRYWRDHYDWHRCEQALNRYDHFITEIDGLDIHFMHIKSPRLDARPLLMTHGWPGSILEFMDVIEPLTNPSDSNAPAYHLIIPSLPGYGFSGRPTETGWGAERTAKAWDALMLRLGYDRYFAQGGDWGSLVTCMIGVQNQGHCAALHVNLVVVGPPSAEIASTLTPEEAASLAHFGEYQSTGSGYAEIQRTKPQTLGYALADSPVGQMAWIIEKFQGWSDAQTDNPEAVFDRDRLLDNVMLYWLTNSGASSARFYWESFANPNIEPIHIPSGCSIFPHEIMAPSRRWAETRFKNLCYWGEAEKGGHFAAMEQPAIFVDEIRGCFDTLSL